MEPYFIKLVCWADGGEVGVGAVGEVGADNINGGVGGNMMCDGGDVAAAGAIPSVSADGGGGISGEGGANEAISSSTLNGGDDVSSGEF